LPATIIAPAKAPRSMIIKIPRMKRGGERTHHQLQSITLPNFKPMNRSVKALRLNGTSDLDWDQPKWKSLFDIEAFCKREGIERYEYTKVPNRWKLRPGVSWTYSLNEGPNSERWASDYLANGFNCAVVFRDGPPTSFSVAGKDFIVINGDEHDLRFADPGPCVVGLKAKGWAKQDVSGFVR